MFAADVKENFWNRLKFFVAIEDIFWLGPGRGDGHGIQKLGLKTVLKSVRATIEDHFDNLEWCCSCRIKFDQYWLKLARYKRVVFAQHFGLKAEVGLITHHFGYKIWYFFLPSTKPSELLRQIIPLLIFGIIRFCPINLEPHGKSSL